MRPTELKDPFKLAALLWPDVRFYSKQREVIASVRDNFETVVHAGNMLGKDFVAAFIVLWFFLTRHPCREVTTSVDHGQLASVLWGEIRNFIQTSRYPLTVENGGPLLVNHLHLRKVYGGELCGLSYVLGRMAAKGEGMLGHHIADIGDGVPRTMFVADEASGVDDESHKRASTWAKRMFSIGNCYPCTNFFRRSVKEGNRYVEGRLYRNVVCIRGEDSPNVRYALKQRSLGIEPTGEVILPGVLPWYDYKERRAAWSEDRQCVGIDGLFWEGKDVLMFPPAVLAASKRAADELPSKRRAKAIGVDSAQGGDNTAMAAVDERGLIELRSLKTPDTNRIVGDVRDFMREHRVEPQFVGFDIGGGGKQHADRLRAKGLPVRTIAFGESVNLELQRGYVTFNQRVANREDKQTYFNRRAEMYGELRDLMDESTGHVFAVPSEYEEVFQQLGAVPNMYTDEGKLKLLSKKELIRQIGHSPDEADALVLAVHCMLHVPVRHSVGAGGAVNRRHTNDRAT